MACSLVLCAECQEIENPNDGEDPQAYLDLILILPLDKNSENHVVQPCLKAKQNKTKQTKLKQSTTLI